MLVFKELHYQFKLEVRMQSKNTVTIVHAMAGMCCMQNYKCVIWYTDVGHTLKHCIINGTYGANTETVRYMLLF